MTKQHAETLLKWYEDSLPLVENGYDFIKDERFIKHGLCYCSEKKFGVKINDIDLNINTNYIYPTPIMLNNKNEIINSLIFRINFLKDLISTK